MTRRTPSPKKQAERILSEVEGVLAQLYERMRAHVDFEFTEQMALATLVKSDDLDMVKRSGAMYGHLRNEWQASRMYIRAEDQPDIMLTFTNKISFVPPRYMDGRVSSKDINPAFYEVIAPWTSQLQPIRELYDTARAAWQQLAVMTKHDPSRIQALWPTINAIAQYQDRPFPKLPKPVGLPSPPPELREKLNIATTFINSALMMPAVERSNTPIRIEYHG